MLLFQVNGEDVQNATHEEAMEVFQRTADPVIVVEVMRRVGGGAPAGGLQPLPSSAEPPFQVGGGGGLVGTDSNSELSSILGSGSGSRRHQRSVGVQTLLGAGEMAASAAIIAASYAAQEARMALASGRTGSMRLPSDAFFFPYVKWLHINEIFEFN